MRSFCEQRHLQTADVRITKARVRRHEIESVVRLSHAVNLMKHGFIKQYREVKENEAHKRVAQRQRVVKWIMSVETRRIIARLRLNFLKTVAISVFNRKRAAAIKVLRRFTKVWKSRVKDRLR
jgi:hypothetical protein